MEMKQCAQSGHFYDASIHNECPYCKSLKSSAAAAYDSMRSTQPGTQPGIPQNAPQDTQPNAANQSDIGKTMPIARPAQDYHAETQPGAGDTGRTVPIIKQKLGVDPVVGWLINLDGEEKGRDYRIHTDNNFIGRSERMDICILGDDTISRENHAIVSYDARDKVFYFSPVEGRSIIRCNDKALFYTTELKARDIIEIGKTRLLFLPLCGEEFEWD